MYTIHTTNRFEKDIAKCRKRGLDLNKLKEVISLLAKKGQLPGRYKPHKLSGRYTGMLGMPHPTKLAADMAAG